MDLAAAGRRLASAGINERAFKACFGIAATAQVSRGRRFDERPPPAAVAPWLGAGGTVEAALARKVLGEVVDVMVREGLWRDGEVIAPAVRLLPCGPAIVVCDLEGGAVVPDDSSHHLLGALPARRPGRWLDLGTGAAWAPLAAPWRAGACVAADLEPRAIALARLGAALAGRDDLDLRVADLADGITGPFDLVTCNAPIPAPGDELLARLWAAIPALIAPGGEAIVHSVLGAEPPPGAVVIARYTPPGVRPFGVTWWRPGTGDRRVAEIALTDESPHVTRDSVGA